MTTEEKKLQGEKMGRRMIEAMGRRTKQLQAERALQQALLEDLTLERPEHIEQRHHVEQEKQKQVQAVERQAKQIAQQSEQLIKRSVEQIAEVNELVASIRGGKPITKVDKVTAENETTKLSNDDQYRINILTMMKARISQQTRK